MLERRIDLARKPPRLQRTFLFDLHPRPECIRADRYRARRCNELFREVQMNLQPLGDRLIVEVLEEEETTAGGIVLPDTAKEKPQRGRVLAVGPGARDEDGKRIELDVATGDQIVFSKYGGTEFKVGADEVLILRESDVLAKVMPRTTKRKRQLAGATA
jgi:chaperonin GroES